MRILLVLLLAILAACAQMSRGGRVVKGAAGTVVVDWENSGQGTSGALAAADAHCAKFGKRAKVAGDVTAFEIAYDCVK